MSKQELKDFTPEKHISIDAEHTLEQISGRFQSIRDGLPELIKNSKDHYSRLGVKEKKDRQIVVMISDDKKNLGVLDFAGAALENFEGWRVWSSRTANQKQAADDIEGGYGNGGKSFMVRGCNLRATMCGYSNGKINKWGFINDEPKLKFREGVFKDEYGRELKDLEVSDAKYLLNKEISDFGVSVDSLPDAARNAFFERNCFTFVNLQKIKGWDELSELNLNRAIHRIPSDLMEHAQASLTIETCTVWVIQGNKKIYPRPLEVADLEPFEGLENERIIPIPDKLVDPDNEGEILFRFKEPAKNNLVIKTSKLNLRMVDRLKTRNVIWVKNNRNIVANWTLADLVSLTQSCFLYGTLTCELFDNSEFLVGSDRVSLADKPQTRALKSWVAERLTEVAKEILKIQASRNAREDVDTASQTLDKLRNLMREFLQIDGPEGNEGQDEPQGLALRYTKGGKKLKGLKVSEIVLEGGQKEINIPLGSVVPLVVKSYAEIDGKKIKVKNPALYLASNNEEIIEWVDGYYIKSNSLGSTRIRFETTSGRVKSNEIIVNVKNIESLELKEVSQILKQGESVRLDVKALDAKKNLITNLIYEAHVDEMEMGKINRSCVFTAGGIEGVATVRIRYGPGDEKVRILKIQIGPEQEDGSGGSKGIGIPYILLCEKPAPGREDLPTESRTHWGGEEHPTIIDCDPLWTDVIWINYNSHESKKVRMRGEGGHLSISTQRFQQFLAIKCFEILKRLKVEESFRQESKSMTEFKRALAMAEMETAGFIEKAYILVRELVKGNEDE